MKKALFATVVFVFAAGALLAAPPDGYVVKTDSGDTIYLDWGTKSGVVSGDTFTVFRPGETLKHPVTGEILGTTQQTLGTGVVNRVDEKFSVGHLNEVTNMIKPGDRTHWQAAATAGETKIVPTLLALKERWHSDPYPMDVVALAIGDLVGKGEKQLIAASTEKIQVFQWQTDHLVTGVSFEERQFRHWLSVETADLKHQGHDEIFANAWLDGPARPHVYVLSVHDGQLKITADFAGFVRAINGPDGTRRLYWQDLTRSRTISFTAPCELTWQDGKYRPGPLLTVKTPFNSTQLFGFAWGKWEVSESTPSMAVLDRGDTLSVFLATQTWHSKEAYGGTRNDFRLDDQHLGSLLPRLEPYTAIAGGKEELILTHAIPELGVQLGALKLYKKSDLFGLAWDGQAMSPLWQQTLDGYVADYALADLLHESTPQLWVAASAPGNKTVFLAYTLP